MPIVNIICPICTEVFENADEVRSTDCGHLFHSACMDDWLRREGTCPQCRKQSPYIHKLHLSFVESNEVEQTQEDFQIKIKSSEEKVAELLLQKQENEEHFLKLQEQYTLADSVKKDFEIKARQINNADDEFLRLQAQYTENSEIQKHLEDRINQLYVENECKTKELQDEMKENEKLKLNIVSGGLPLPLNKQSEKIKDLENKLNFTLKELEKEVNITTILSVEKIKLQSYINNYQSGENKESITSMEKNKKSNSRKKPAVTKRLPNNSTPKSNEHVNRIVIKGMSLNQLTVPLENFVIRLASKMNLNLSSDDFIKVNISDNSFKSSSSVLLLVEFKDSKIKQMFVSNKKLLEEDPDTKAIIIEVMNPDQELLTYAKKRLSQCALQFFYFENNDLFAKKHEKHPDIVHIQCKNQVDDLFNAFNSKKS